MPVSDRQTVTVNPKHFLQIMTEQTHQPTAYRVYAMYQGKEMQHGTVCYTTGRGWRFYPVYQANPSRKFWPTPEAALKGRLDHTRLEATRYTVDCKGEGAQ